MIGALAHKRWAAPVALGVILLASVVIFRACRPARDTRYDPLCKSLGAVTAEETIRLVGPTGNIVIHTFNLHDAADPSYDLPVKMFQRTLQKQAPGIKIIATELVSLDITTGPLRDDQRAELMQQFRDMLAKYPDAAAIVSFAGTPPWYTGPVPPLPEKRPIVIVASTAGLAPSQQFYTAGMVQLAIVPKGRTGPLEQKKRTSREWFDEFYKIVTPESATTQR